MSKKYKNQSTNNIIRGFTLIELLAVLTILAIILLISFPLLNNTINTSKDNSRKNSINLYGKAIETAIADYYTENPEVGSVTLDELETGGYLKYKGNKVECNEVQIVHRNVYLNDCKVGEKYVDYTYGKVIPVPELAQGLTPIEYDGDKWVVADSDGDTWYNYDKQRWANAVTLLPGVRKNIGDEVKVDGTEASMMLVWVPRYEYKYTNLGDQYAGGTQDEPGGIDINFILTSRTTPSSDEYKIHPAFTFGDKELNGFWIGKFEISHTTLSSSEVDNNLGCSTTSCESAEGLRVLPNVISLRNNDVSNFWYGIKSIENKTNVFGLSNIDVHMMKNSEWGAVAYLSQSKYGKYGNSDYEGAKKEVYINNSKYYYTGRSGGNPGGSTPINETYTEETSTEQYTDYGYYTYDGYLLEYNSNNKTSTKDINKGAGASTTGNIYGVYDMSGGTWEYVMGVYGDSEGIYSGYSTSINSGFNGRTGNDNGNITNGAQVPDSKYYDIYVNSTNSDSNDGSLSCNNGVCFGHAMSETSGWYKDSAYMVYSSYPWFVRGGEYYYSKLAGVFHRANISGKAGNTSTHIIFTVK